MYLIFERNSRKEPLGGWLADETNRKKTVIAVIASSACFLQSIRRLSQREWVRSMSFRRELRDEVRLERPHNKKVRDHEVNSVRRIAKRAMRLEFHDESVHQIHSQTNGED